MFSFLKNLFRTKKTKGEGMVALDLGAEMVKAVFFTIEEKQNQNGEVIGKRAVIKAMSEVVQVGGDFPGNLMTDIASVIENSKEVIRRATGDAGELSAKLVIGVAGESIKGATYQATYQREDPLGKINLSELHHIVHKLEWKAFAELRKKISDEMGYPEIDIKLIHSAIVDVRIDGYKVTNPLGFQGKEVSLSIFNCFAPLAHYEALHAIGENLGLELGGIISDSYALSQALMTEEKNWSAILIDVGGSATKIAVIHQGALLGTKVFGIGGRTFTKRMALELNVSFKEAEELKKAYAADKLEPKSKKIITTFLESDLAVWLEGVVLGLSEFKEMETSLPSKVFLTGGGSLLPSIKDALNNQKWYKKLPFIQAPQAFFVKPSDLPLMIDESKKIKDQQSIVPAALATCAIEFCGEETVMQKALRKVIGIMQV